MEVFPLLKHLQVSFMSEISDSKAANAITENRLIDEHRIDQRSLVKRPKYKPEIIMEIKQLCFIFPYR